MYLETFNAAVDFNTDDDNEDANSDGSNNDEDDADADIDAGNYRDNYNDGINNQLPPINSCYDEPTREETVSYSSKECI